MKGSKQRMGSHGAPHRPGGPAPAPVSALRPRQVDPDTRDMLKELDMDKLPNIATTTMSLGGARRR